MNRSELPLVITAERGASGTSRMFTFEDTMSQDGKNQHRYREDVFVDAEMQLKP